MATLWYLVPGCPSSNQNPLPATGEVAWQPLTPPPCPPVGSSSMPYCPLSLPGKNDSCLTNTFLRGPGTFPGICNNVPTNALCCLCQFLVQRFTAKATLWEGCGAVLLPTPLVEVTSSTTCTLPQSHCSHRPCAGWVTGSVVVTALHSLAFANNHVPQRHNRTLCEVTTLPTEGGIFMKEPGLLLVGT